MTKVFGNTLQGQRACRLRAGEYNQIAVKMIDDRGNELVVVKGLKGGGVMNVKQKSLFAVLPDELESILRDGNPWWRGEPIFKLPKMRRWAFTPVLQGLQDGLTPAVVLRGPRANR